VRPYLKKEKEKKNMDGMAQVVEYLPSKLSSNPSITNKQIRKNKTKRCNRDAISIV
jgi:hypothetical protein